MLLALFFAISFLKTLVLLHVHVHVEVTHTFCTCGSDAILQKAVLQCKKRLFYRSREVVDSVHVFFINLSLGITNLIARHGFHGGDYM